MAHDFEEGYEDVADMELNDELRGRIVDAPPSNKPLRIALVTGTVFALSLGMGWGMYWMSRTDERIAKERLTNHRYIYSLLQDVRRAVREPNTTTAVLLDAVDNAIFITQSPLRNEQLPNFPAIQEKYLALIEALEGLLRLELEGRMRLDNQVERYRFEALLASIGKVQLEYWEAGLRKSEPLLTAAATIERVRGVNSSAALESELESIKTEESFSVVAAAYRLGRWFRYKNDLESAERCFQIGRRYVDGYELKNELVEGHRPTEISPIWHEYAGCLAALSEIRFVEKRYREARSYLARMFNTPSSTQAIAERYELVYSRPVSPEKMQALEADIQLLEDLEEHPGKLRSFPLFSPDECDVYALIAQELRDTAESPEERRPSRQLWESMGPEAREAIFTETLAGAHDHEKCIHLSTTLNRYIKENDLVVDFGITEPMETAALAHYLDKHQKGELTPQEQMELNRIVIDTLLGSAAGPVHQLSDGKRLSHALTPRQRAGLISLYEKQLASQRLNVEDTGRISERLESLSLGGESGTVSEYLKALKDSERYADMQRGELLAVLDETRQAAARLADQMRQLESLAELQLDSISDIQAEQSILQARESIVNEQLAVVDSKERDLDVHRELIRSDLKRLLAQKQNQYAQLSGELQQYQSIGASEPLLEQIDSQISLRQQYVSLLKGLQDTEGTMRLQHLKLQRIRMDEEIALLQEKIATTGGDEREELLVQYNELEEARHDIIVEFDRILTPIQVSVRRIADKEAEIWKAEKVLKQTREEIFHLLGSAEIPGSLKAATLRRSELLHLIQGDRPQPPGFAMELRELNQFIAQGQAKLQMLLQREESAKEILKLFYPHIVGNSPLIRGGALAPLRSYLKEQETLMEQYQRLWVQSELWEQIRRDEGAIRDQLREITDVVAEHPILSELQNTRMTRAMQNLLLARKRLAQSRQLMRRAAEGLSSRTEPNEVTARGYLLDTAEIYEMEHQLGLHLDETRRAYEERHQLSKELNQALAQQSALNQQRLDAVGDRDQARIDALLPQIARIETHIVNLSERAADINSRIRRVSKRYEASLDTMQAYRERLLPRIEEYRSELITLNQRMTESDDQLNVLVSELFSHADALSRSLTSLREDDLNNLDQLIANQEEEIARLIDLRDLKFEENFYKTRALWLMADSLYQQSQLRSYTELSAAAAISDEQIRDQSRNSSLLFEEFDEQAVYSDRLLGNTRDMDEEQAATSLWTAYLENQALSIFSEHIPRYTTGKSTRPSERTDDIEKDLRLYEARARFFTGKIRMNRALRDIHVSGKPPKENPKAIQQLDLAQAAFLHFLDYVLPLHYTRNSEAAPISARFEGFQEFPYRTRRPLRLEDEARITLGVINTLRGDYNEAISYYRQLVAESMESLPMFQEVNGEMRVDPVVLDNFSFDRQVHPVFSALLSQKELAHESLYRLGRNYQLLADETYQEILAYTPPPYDGLEALKNERQSYLESSLAYYSQLILTQAFSPFRRAALLQRSRIYNELGNYDAARNDLVAILGSPQHEGGSLQLAQMTVKGDLPGELDPGYAYVAFELGKLHLAHDNYVAAADAFNRAQSVDHSHDVVIHAKTAYADALIRDKKWLMADILLGELIEVGRSRRTENTQAYPVDLELKRAEVRIELGHLQGARDLLTEVFKTAPAPLWDGTQFNLDEDYGWTLLETNYRDSIRPLAEACKRYADLSLQLKDYEKSRQYYDYAERFFRKVPWKEDRLLQNRSYDEFVSFRQEELLETRWGRLKSRTQALLTSTFAPFRQQFAQLRGSQEEIDPGQILTEIEVSRRESAELREQQLEILEELNRFWTRENEKLPENIALRAVQRRRAEARRSHDPELIDYEASARLRYLASAINDIEQLLLQVPPESVEESIVESFALDFAEQMLLTEEDRIAMTADASNVQNLLVIPNKEERLASFSSDFKAWLDARMSSSGLDFRFIPTSPQTGVLEEIDLHRVSLLSIFDDAKHHKEMVEIAERAIEKSQAYPPRVRNPETVWETVEIAAISSNSVGDWESSLAFNRFLLDEEQQKFFIRPDSEDRYRARLALAEAQLNLGRQIMEESVFTRVAEQRELMQEDAQIYLNEAQRNLEQLAGADELTDGGVTSRIRAKQLLRETGI